MSGSSHSTSPITTYLDQLDPESRIVLEHIDDLINKTVPQAQKSFSYGMPAYKYRGKPLIYYGSFKGHLSVFPTSGPIAELEPQLAKYKTGKGTLQFTPGQPLPDEIIIKLLKTRIEQIDSSL